MEYCLGSMGKDNVINSSNSSLPPKFSTDRENFLVGASFFIPITGIIAVAGGILLVLSSC